MMVDIAEMVRSDYNHKHENPIELFKYVKLYILYIASIQTHPDMDLIWMGYGI